MWEKSDRIDLEWERRPLRLPHTQARHCHRVPSANLTNPIFTRPKGLRCVLDLCRDWKNDYMSCLHHSKTNVHFRTWVTTDNDHGRKNEEKSGHFPHLKTQGKSWLSLRGEGANTRLIKKDAGNTDETACITGTARLKGRTTATGFPKSTWIALSATSFKRGVSD